MDDIPYDIEVGRNNEATMLTLLYATEDDVSAEDKKLIIDTVKQAVNVDNVELMFEEN